MVLPPPCPLHAFYPQKKISQGINLFGEGRRYRRKGKQSNGTSNNNLVIKQSQGPLAPSQGLWIIF